MIDPSYWGCLWARLCLLVSVGSGVSKSLCRRDLGEDLVLNPTRSTGTAFLATQLPLTVALTALPSSGLCP